MPFPIQPPFTPLDAHSFLNGATFALNVIASLLFMRFYRKTKDRLFLFFSAAFAILGVNRLAFLASDIVQSEYQTIPYLVRLAAFALIIYAIIDKNHSRAASGPLKR